MIQISRKAVFYLFLLLGLWSTASAQDTIRTYYDEGSLHIKEVLTKINGKAEGEVRLYDPNGKLILIGTLKNDQRNGLFYDLNPETGDTLRIVPFKNNLREGKAMSFFPGGNLSQESTFSANQLEGKVISYYEDGTVSDQTNFKNNKPEGVSEAYFTTGKIKSRINFLAGQYHGSFEEFEENGQIILSATYERGVLNGRETQYFSDGKI